MSGEHRDIALWATIGIVTLVALLNLGSWLGVN